jgi:hypothetical protein
MSRAKAEIASRLPIRRGLGQSEAALYIGIGPTLFSELVRDGLMPRPRLIGARRVWDVDELDAFFRALPVEGGGGNIAAAGGSNPWHD